MFCVVILQCRHYSVIKSVTTTLGFAMLSSIVVLFLLSMFCSSWQQFVRAH